MSSVPSTPSEDVVGSWLGSAGGTPNSAFGCRKLIDGDVDMGGSSASGRDVPKDRVPGGSPTGYDDPPIVAFIEPSSED